MHSNHPGTGTGVQHEFGKHGHKAAAVTWRRQPERTEVSLLQDGYQAGNAGRSQQPQPEQGIPALLNELRSCAKKKDLHWGRQIHERAARSQCDSNRYVATGLIRMYAKCGSMVEASRVFRSIQDPNVVSWTALLSGYAENGEGHVCLELFSKMKADGCAPNSVTYVAVLKACKSLMVNGDAQGLELGSRIHLEIGHHMDCHLQTTLVDMYATSGNMVKARQIFESIPEPDVVSWNALLSGYAANGEGQASLDQFSRMKTEGCAPSFITYVAVLKSLAAECDACGKQQCYEMGREIHVELGGHSSNVYVQCTLIDMYCKCGSMVDARRVFDSMQKPDLVSWTALLLGYAENGQGHVSLELFSKMKADGCVPDSVAYVAVLKACGSIGALSLGRKFHSEIPEFTIKLVTSLVDFYAKCGSMGEAREVFDMHPKARDRTTWTVLLAGYSSCGDTDSVFNLFEEMKDRGFRPGTVTFVWLLLCCSHAGLVSKAKQYLEEMPAQYGLSPDAFHYSCMVDVLGRANQLHEAVSVVRRMECNPYPATWSAMLSGCRMWKNVEVGRMAFQSLVEMDRTEASAYVLMSHIYGSRGMWEEQARVLQLQSRQEACGASETEDPIIQRLKHGFSKR